MMKWFLPSLRNSTTRRIYISLHDEEERVKMVKDLMYKDEKTDVKITLSVDYVTAENLMRMLKVGKQLAADIPAGWMYLN